MPCLFMSPSGDLPLNHPSALIGLNVELLVDWQTASVLWFVDRWWDELKVSTVTSCVWVCVCVCALNTVTVHLKCNAGKQRTATNMFLTRFKSVIEIYDSNMRGKERIMGTSHKKDWIWSCSITVCKGSYTDESYKVECGYLSALNVVWHSLAKCSSRATKLRHKTAETWIPVGASYITRQWSQDREVCQQRSRESNL